MQRRHALSTLALLCSPHAQGAGEALLGPASRARHRALDWPADFGAHPQSRIEWWYLTGVLQPSDAVGAGGAELGFQVTFFRTRTDVRADHPSAFAARQIVFAHAAVSDPAARRLRHDERIARSGFGVAETGEGDTRIVLRDWTLVRDGPVTHSRYRAQVRSESAAFGLDLSLRATQPVLLQGDAGWSRKGPRPEQASWYYSQPQLEASGTLTLDGRSRTVRGRAWFDHEWSDSLLDPDAVGWNWIGMNLADGGALTAFALRRADGSALWAGGSFRAAAGAASPFAPDEVRFRAGRRWTSPATGAVYPVQWAVETPVGAFTVVPRFDAQEIDARATTATVYWEGLSDLIDAAGRRVGSGYLEMTGYAGRLRL
jgi:predicted secreted hydrolase